MHILAQDPLALRSLGLPSDEVAEVEAVRALGEGRLPGSLEALRRALRSPSGPVRLEAAIALSRREPLDDGDRARFLRMLRRDPAPLVRHRLLAILDPPAAPDEPPRSPDAEAAALEGLAIALADPVWRVRLDAVRRLLAREASAPGALAAARAMLGDATPAAEAALWFADFLRGDRPPPQELPDALPRDAPVSPARPPLGEAPWWDPDPASLHQNLRALDEDDWRDGLRWLPGLLALQDGYPVDDALQESRRMAAEALVAWGDAGSDRAVLALLDEPRVPYAGAWAWTVLERLPKGRREELTHTIPFEATRPPELSHRPPWFSRGARRRGGRAVQRLIATAPPDPTPAPTANPRPLGFGGPIAPPLIVSGRHHLPERGYAEALAAGCDTFFWEPGYEALTASLQRMPRASRARIRLIAGTFEAEPRAIRRDLERALQLTRAGSLAAFIVFWARSPSRIDDDVAEALLRAQERGEIQRFGVSTHHRWLALEAIERGWPLVMVRHSAAHRGAEREVFPAAAAAGVGVLTFSALCYARLLRAPPGVTAPSAADCYRYTLSQPGVSACVSAPRTVEQLRANLAALAQPTLDAEGIARLRAVGDRVYRESRAFLDLIRAY